MLPTWTNRKPYLQIPMTAAKPMIVFLHYRVAMGQINWQPR